MNNQNTKQHLFSLLISIIIPIIVYFGLRTFFNDAYALIASSVIPILRTIYVLIRRKKVDIIAIVSIIGFIVSLAIFKFAGGNLLSVKLYHVVITGIIGLVMLISAAINKPVLAALVKKRLTVAQLENQRMMKKISFYNTIVGLIFLLDAILHVIMASFMSTDEYVVYSKIVTIALVGILFILVTYLKRKRQS